MSISNWNRNPVIKNGQLHPYSGELLKEPFCIRGNGRSYGDVSLDQRMLSMLPNRDVLQLEGNVLTVSSGFTLKDVLNYVVPKGYIVPVIPGTQHVTVGGMIAADVHGKNHERNGTIGHWVDEIELILPNGEHVHCSRNKKSELFAATIGGIGLTGVIITVKLRLEKIVSDKFEQRVIEASSLMDLVNKTDKSQAKYKVAWFDFERMSGFYLMETEESKDPIDLSNFQLKKAKISIPFTSFPFVNGALMKVYNKRFAAGLKKQTKETPLLSVDETFFPLDRIANWNRLYGTRGFFQFQFSFPMKDLESRLMEIVDMIHASGHMPVLSVLKKHGAIESPGMLSYPHEGISIALDFINSRNVSAFLKELYKRVAELGGRSYLIKDALLDSDSFNKMYDKVDQFKAVVDEVNDGQIGSLMAKRLNLVQGMKRKVLIIGANSDIGFASAQAFIDKGCEVVLAAHKPNELESTDAEIMHVDVTEVDDALEKLSKVDCDIVVYAAGKMAENEEALFTSAGATVRDVNYNGAIAILGMFAQKFKERKSGTILGISSVAADRGKSSNVVYGSAKAGFDTFLAGLRQYLQPHNVRVVTIRPGYVKTKMTEGMDLPGKLTASKTQVAEKIVKHALGGSRNVIYVLPIWRPIMWTLKHIPERIFKRKQL